MVAHSRCMRCSFGQTPAQSMLAGAGGAPRTAASECRISLSCASWWKSAGVAKNLQVTRRSGVRRVVRAVTSIACWPLKLPCCSEYLPAHTLPLHAISLRGKFLDDACTSAGQIQPHHMMITSLLDKNCLSTICTGHSKADFVQGDKAAGVEAGQNG